MTNEDILLQARGPKGIRMTSPRNFGPMLLRPKRARKEVAKVTPGSGVSQGPSNTEFQARKEAGKCGACGMPGHTYKNEAGERLAPTCATQHHMPPSLRQSQKPNRARGRASSLERCAAVL